MMVLVGGLVAGVIQAGKIGRHVGSVGSQGNNNYFSDLPQQKDYHRENAILLPQKSEGLSNKVRSGVNRVRKARKIKTNFFSSSVTTPLLNAMKSTMKLFQNPFKRTSKRKISKKPDAKSK